MPAVLEAILAERGYCVDAGGHGTGGDAWPGRQPVHPAGSLGAWGSCAVGEGSPFPIGSRSTTYSQPSRRLPHRVPIDGAGRSAVLVALADGAHGAEVLPLVAVGAAQSSGGEVAFPGGRLDPGENPVQAALREAHEVLLEPDRAEIEGELEHIATFVTRSHIVPVVGRLIGRPELRPGTSRGRAAVLRPARRAAAAGVFRQERWGNVRSSGRSPSSSCPTRRAPLSMLVDLLSVALGR